jgi:ech hydrogenase subunit A
MTAETALLFTPALAGLVILFLRPLLFQYVIVIVAFITVSVLSLGMLEGSDMPLKLGLSSSLSHLIVALDVMLLLFFLREGVRFRSPAVWGLALVQLALYGFIETQLGGVRGSSILVDPFSELMFLIVNIVGGVIVLYALGYMQGETVSAFRKRVFIAYLLIFMSVMNLLVVANSLMLFFFLFEMTTLASYLLIRFRGDDEAQGNALRALWMNQIGGVAILLGALVALQAFDTIYFDTLIAADGEYLLLAVGLVSMAAFVKGASMPFDSWLLGAMVAPTPVSAMLHSATMVKIAPFIIMKFVFVIAGTLLGAVISIFGIGVFVVASYLALSKTKFKEILGLSTIAMLGLMMSLLTLGSGVAVQVAMLLMLFHALSKALLFLLAGNLERAFHLKEIDDMKGLVYKAPKNVTLVIFGFMSMILPPFGVFVGKLLALQIVAEMMQEHPWQLAVLLGIAIGSVLLTLLYFKIVSALLSRPSDTRPIEADELPRGLMWPVYLLSGLILVASAGMVYGFTENIGWFAGTLLALFVAIPTFYYFTAKLDRTGVYHCGEKEPFDAALFYFTMPQGWKIALYWTFGGLFASLALAGVLS